MRGGARVGSGRKPGKIQKRTVSFRLKEQTVERIRELREDGVDVTTEIEQYINDIYEGA